MTPAHPLAAGLPSGIRVVDLTCGFPARCEGTLASQGAEVIKVEALSGDVTRRSRQKSPGFAPSCIACNRQASHRPRP